MIPAAAVPVCECRVCHDTETIDFDVPGTLILKQSWIDTDRGGGIHGVLLGGILMVLLVAAFAGTKILVAETK